MSPSVGSAIEQALGFLRSPSLLSAARQRLLPEQDMQVLLRLAAGDEGSLTQTAAATGEPHARLAEAAAFYIQQVLFTPGTDSYRVLGVNPDAPDHRIKDHYRALVRWLHPDRNADGWEGVYLDRVNRAWQDLRSMERRCEYDRKQTQRVAAPPNATAMSCPPSKRVVLRPLLIVEPEVLPARALRFFPMVMVGGVGLAVLSLLAVIYGFQSSGWPFTAPTHVVNRPVVSLAEVESTPHAAEDRKTTLTNNLPVEEVHQDPVSLLVPPPIELVPVNAKLANTLGPPVLELKPSVAMAHVNVAKGIVAPALMPHEVSSVDLPIIVKPTVAVTVPESESASSASDAVSTHIASTQNSPKLISMNDRLAGELLDNFRQAYDASNLPQLLALFTRAARDRVDDGQTLAQMYRHLFESSRKRQLSFKAGRWRVDGESTYITARFDAAIVPQGKLLTRHDTGNIHFELQREDGVWRIAKLSHDSQ